MVIRNRQETEQVDPYLEIQLFKQMNVVFLIAENLSLPLNIPNQHYSDIFCLYVYIQSTVRTFSNASARRYALPVEA